MRITGQVAAAGPVTVAPIPVPTQPVTRPEAGILARLAAVHAARDSRPLRVVDSDVPDRWHNPAPVAAKLVAPKPKPAKEPKPPRDRTNNGAVIRWDLARATTMRENGATYRTIGDALGVDYRSIARKLGALGVQMKVPATHPDGTAHAVIALHHEGLGTTAIAARLGIDRSTAYKHLSRQGIAPHQTKKPPRPMKHGGPSGAASHRRRGEEPCDECRLAHNAYNVLKKAKSIAAQRDGTRSGTARPAKMGTPQKDPGDSANCPGAWPNR